jgi:hypothetical protein
MISIELTCEEDQIMWSYYEIAWIVIESYDERISKVLREQPAAAIASWRLSSPLRLHPKRRAVVGCSRSTLVISIVFRVVCMPAEHREW